MPTTTARGYGAKHRAERERWRPLVESGQAVCWRCSRLIPPGAPWDLGHDDADRTRYMGPEHQFCNRGAGGRKARRRAAIRRTASAFQRRAW